jgi:hypothetical protein
MREDAVNLMRKLSQTVMYQFKRHRQQRFSRHRVCGIERLESRLALAADSGQVDRPPLEQSASVYINESQIGPAPIVIAQSTLVGEDTNSFVIQAVANGVVHKWMPQTNSWLDVSTPPESSNPQQLLEKLTNRLIHQGDQIRWIPDGSTSPSDFQDAFAIIGWDDGSPLLPPSTQVPSAVQNLAFGQSEGSDSLTVTWDAPVSGAEMNAALQYTVTMNDGLSSTTYLTTSTNQAFSGLKASRPYTFWVWASNSEGAGPTASISGTPTADQTPTFSAVNEWDRDYSLTFAEYDMGTASIPTLQSFASAVHNDQWILLAGRTNGLHKFTGDGLENFPPKYQNTDVWVIDPITKESWSRSLEDETTGLSQSAIASLSATNTQSYQDGDTLFIVGGYVFDWSTYEFTTYNALSAIDLPSLVSWVKGADYELATNAILQRAGETASDGSYSGGFFAVTGGGLEKVPEADRFQLIFGQNFEGGYTPGSNGVYTSQVRSFDVVYDMSAGTLDYANESVSPFGGDPALFRRRDLNVFPILAPDGQGGTTASTVALAGVFYNGSGVWTVPVEIGADGIPQTENPTDAPLTFRQAMNQYESGKIGLYSQSMGEMTQILLGGISANVYDPGSGDLTYDSHYGFNRQITAVIRDAAGNYQQQYLTEFPDIYDGEGNLLYFGANARFFAAPGVSVFGDDIIDSDALTSETVIGYMFGGIAADRPNFGTTVASPLIFEVTFSPSAD